MKASKKKDGFLPHVGRVFAAVLLGFAISVPYSSAEKANLTPIFPPPCSANGTCRQLDPCADAGFGQCKTFRAVPGLRRELSGHFGTLEFRAQTVNIETGKPVSLWHDVSLIVSDDEKGLIVNAFFEISRGTQAKVELNKWEPYNPMWQDRGKVKKQGFKRPRYYAWSPAPGNYGAMPRTWENVLEDDPITGFPGDSDPIDVIDIGSMASPLGLVYRVKVIGALGMIDGTDLETDWKIFVINMKDPDSARINDISDVPLELKNQWGIFWRFYKTARGLNENFFYDPGSIRKIHADPVWLGAKEARKIVLNAEAAYRKLVDECLNRRLKRPYWIPGCSP